MSPTIKGKEEESSFPLRYASNIAHVPHNKRKRGGVLFSFYYVYLRQKLLILLP